MSYKIGVFVNLVVITALGLHHWFYPNPDNQTLALLILPVLLVFARWIRSGVGEPLISPSYSVLRRFGYKIGITFVWMALVAALWVVPVFLEILQGSPYLYISGAFVVMSAFLFALGFLVVEIDMRIWRTSIEHD